MELAPLSLGVRQATAMERAVSHLRFWARLIAAELRKRWKRRDNAPRAVAEYQPKSAFGHMEHVRSRTGFKKDYDGRLVKAAYVHHTIVMIVKLPFFAVFAWIEKPLVFYPSLAIIVPFLIYYLLSH